MCFLAQKKIVNKISTTATKPSAADHNFTHRLVREDLADLRTREDCGVGSAEGYRKRATRPICGASPTSRDCRGCEAALISLGFTWTGMI